MRSASEWEIQYPNFLWKKNKEIKWEGVSPFISDQDMYQSGMDSTGYSPNRKGKLTEFRHVPDFMLGNLTGRKTNDVRTA